MSATMRRRTRRMAWGAVAAASCAALALAGAGPALAAGEPTGQAPVTTRIGGFETDFTFNDPLNDAGEDPTQLDTMIRLIDDTPAGAEIDMALFSVSANIFVDALARAQERGVVVRAVQNGSNRDPEIYSDSSPRDIADLLGGNSHWCDHGSDTLAYGSGCISTDDYGIAHAKYMLFSKTKDRSGHLRSNVVWFGSANQTYATGTKMANNTVTVYGDRTLYDNFHAQMWTPQWEERSYDRNDFYDPEHHRGIWGSGGSHAIVAHASPEQDSDLVADQLATIRPGRECQVQVIQASLHDTRPEVMDRIVALADGGCTVKVAADQIDPETQASFEAAGIPVHMTPVHDKAFVVRARFHGERGVKKVVFTGSHNITRRALMQSDELFIKVRLDRIAYDAYLQHFADVYDGQPAPE